MSRYFQRNSSREININVTDRGKRARIELLIFLLFVCFFLGVYIKSQFDNNLRLKRLEEYYQGYQDMEISGLIDSCYSVVKGHELRVKNNDSLFVVRIGALDYSEIWFYKNDSIIKRSGTFDFQVKNSKGNTLIKSKYINMKELIEKNR